jgi:hypothetical protein
MRAKRLAVLISGSALAAAMATGTVARAQTPLADTARLQGQFQLTGQITVAVGVRGERVGQAIQRSWSFDPSCPTGPCQTIALVRRRATGTDRLVLGLVDADYYAGTGSFYAPLRCHGRLQRRGELVPFSVTVRITNAALGPGGVPVATEVHATYANQLRINRTRCVAAPRRDAAIYDGAQAAQ